MAESQVETAAERCSADDRAWTDRAELWSRRASLKIGNRSKRERRREPIVLCGHGVSLRLEGGSLKIRNGFTHYPQKQETYRFFKGELAIPTRIIMLDGSGSISFDVLSWLSEQHVSLIQMNWNGEVVSIASTNGYAANPFRVNWQIETREHPKKRMKFCISLITKKIEASILTLEKAVRRSDAWEKANQNRLFLIDAARRKLVNKHNRITCLGSQRCGGIFPSMAGNSDQMARHESQASSQFMEGN